MHIQNVKNKVSKGIGILYKAKKVLPKTTLKILYYSIIYPQLLYCIEVWGNASQIYISSLFKLQKRAVRIINSAEYYANNEPIYKELKMLKLSHVYIYSILVFLFKVIKDSLSDIFNELFKFNYNIVARQTRQSNKFHVPVCRTRLYEKTIKFQGVKHWNHLSTLIKYDCSLQSYKKRIKIYLFANFSYS